MTNKLTDATKFLACFVMVLLQVTQQADARQCLLTPSDYPTASLKPVEIVVAYDDHQYFSDPNRRCSIYNYFPYYAGKVTTPTGAIVDSTNCSSWSQLLDLSKGYAPLGVFFRSKTFRPHNEISAYSWEIYGPINQPTARVQASYDSFNAAYVFEEPGVYNITLRIAFNDGTQASDSTNVTVWQRDKTTYYVDSEIGDDRFDGKSMVPSSSCQPAGNVLGFCSGPWKTATRALRELDPRVWDSSKQTSRYTADSICNSYSSKYPTRHLDGNWYALYKDAPVTYAETMKDNLGNLFGPYEAQICSNLSNRTTVTLKPGDQILFKRGLSYDLDTGLFTASNYTKSIDGVTYNYEQVNCSALVSLPHWPKSLGILYGAYGDGVKPIIKNTGYASCTVVDIAGVGMLHLAFQDLEFDLDSASGSQIGRRAIFMSSPATSPIDFIMNRVALKNFNQGVIFYNTHGAFFKDNYFYNSEVTHLFSDYATDVALLNNVFDYSGNHLAYTNFRHGIVVGNKFSRPAFGRTALRIFGTDLAHANESVWVSDNVMQGWIDPRTSDICIPGRCAYADGKRYNYSLVELAPNDPAYDKFTDRLVFKRNKIYDAEYMLTIGGVNDLIISDNLFDTNDGYAVTPRVLVHTSTSRRPLKDVTIYNNVFVERAESVFRSPQLQLLEYSQLACDDISKNTNLSIVSNKIFHVNDGCALTFKNTQGLISCIDASTDSAMNSVNGLLVKDNVVSLLSSYVEASNPIDSVTTVTSPDPVTTVTSTTGTVADSTVTKDIAGSLVRVQDINISMDILKKSVKANAKIVVSDGSGKVLPNATVSINWSGAVSGVSSGVTDSLGTVAFTTPAIRRSGTVTITVVGIQVSGYEYAAINNLITTKSIVY